MTRTIMVNGKIPVEWDEKVVPCRGCGVLIGFGVTPNRKRMPFEVETGEGHVGNSKRGFISHWRQNDKVGKAERKG